MTDPDCHRCGGSGSYETAGDAHRSAGVVPCHCEDPLPPNHWLRDLVDYKPFSLNTVDRGRYREAQRRGREVLRLVAQCQKGGATEGRLQRIAELLVNGGIDCP